MRVGQEGCFHSTSLGTKNTEQERRREIQGLHKNTGHAYSQDVLSLMLGRDEESGGAGRGVEGEGFTRGRIKIAEK